MQHNRRMFLKTLGLATTGTMMFGPWTSNQLIANPQNGVPRNYIFC